MSSLLFSLNLSIRIVSFLYLVIFPISVLYMILSIPYWLWEGYQIHLGKLSNEYLNNRTPARYLLSPFRFYFCKLFGLKFHP
ncbi:MAG: hypothetical protein Q4A78_07420 [Peptostreptococcaceae bacterium]|nr:hypothetical protein [Peptostreptococcaceae bacterium]